MGNIGITELMVLGIVVLLVFGPKRLPEMGRSLGRGMREFKDSVSGDNKSDSEEIEGKPTIVAATSAPVAPVATPVTTTTPAAGTTTDSEPVKVEQR